MYTQKRMQHIVERRNKKISYAKNTFKHQIKISLAKGPPQLFVYTGRLWRGSYERLIKFPKWRKASRMKATRMYKRRERRRAKRETTNGGMILNGEHVLTMRLVVVFVFSAPRPLVWDITF